MKKPLTFEITLDSVEQAVVALKQTENLTTPGKAISPEGLVWNKIWRAMYEAGKNAR